MDEFGLDSLAAELESESSGGSTQLNLSDISRDPDQPRTEFNEEKLQRLADSINAQGVIQPIVVRQDNNDFERYIIIAGERRWRAAKIAGLETIPTIIKEANDTEIVAAQIIENIDREGFTLLDEVNAVVRMCKICGNASKAGDALGKPKSWISKRVRISKSGDLITRFIQEGKSTDVQGNYQLSRLIEKYPEQGKQFVENWIAYPETRKNLRKQVTDLMALLENPPVKTSTPPAETDVEETVNATDSEQVETDPIEDHAPENNPIENKANTEDSPVTPVVSVTTETSIPSVKTEEKLEEVRSFEVKKGEVILMTESHKFVLNEALLKVINAEL